MDRFDQMGPEELKLVIGLILEALPRGFQIVGLGDFENQIGVIIYGPSTINSALVLASAAALATEGTRRELARAAGSIDVTAKGKVM